MERLDSADERNEILPRLGASSAAGTDQFNAADAPDTVLAMMKDHELLDAVTYDRMLVLDFDVRSATVPLQRGGGPRLPTLTDVRKGVEKRLIIRSDDRSGAKVTMFTPITCTACGHLQCHTEANVNGRPAVNPGVIMVLDGVKGCCLPGELLALMGPSGSGKTSLLSIIGGRVPKTVDVKGQVLYNGRPITKRAKRQVGFVLQDDLLYEALTVWETLYFAARLRLPRTMSIAEQTDRVTTVLNALGLSKCRNTLIGGYFHRGVSGGERKRVSVGHELLINPSVLLLDEPTSGLDSTTALQLVATLRGLATGGRSIITTIHQPSARLYGLLDKLLLLSSGRTIYYGKAGCAADWFHRLGYTLPYGTNTADFILDVANGTVASGSRTGPEGMLRLFAAYEALAGSDGDRSQGFQGGESLTDVEGLQAPLEDAVQLPMVRSPSATLREIYGKQQSAAVAVEADGSSQSIPARRAPSRMAKSSSAFSRDPDAEQAQLEADLDEARRSGHSQTIRRTLTRINHLSSNKRAAPRWGASYITQIRLLADRSLKSQRLEKMNKDNFVHYLATGIITGLIWLGTGQKNLLRDGSNALGLLFFEVVFLSFAAMFAALFTFPEEYKHILKERSSGMYRLSAFFFARTASDLPMDCFIPTLFIVIIYFMSGLTRTAESFFANFFATMLTMLVAQSMGLFIGAAVMKPRTAQTITAVITLVMMLVGGYYIASLPGWIEWLKYTSFIYFGYNLIIKIELGHRMLWQCVDGSGVPIYPSDYRTNSACVPVSGKDLQVKLNLPANPTEWRWEALALVGMLIGFRVLVYVALRHKTKPAL